jgi:hypothetical protein
VTIPNNSGIVIKKRRRINQAIALALLPPDIWIVYTIFCSNTRLLGYAGAKKRVFACKPFIP